MLCYVMSSLGVHYVMSAEKLSLQAGFVQVLENLESPGILFWHFLGLESPGERSLVLESHGNLLNLAKNLKCMVGSKEN